MTTMGRLYKSNSDRVLSGESDGHSGQMSNDHAGVIALPPMTVVPPLLVGLLLHFLWTPLSFFPEWWIGQAVGWPLVVAGFLLSAWAIRTMCRAGENPDAYKPTAAIVANGPYALSRNPIYVSFIAVYVGITLVVNTLWPIIFLPVGIAPCITASSPARRATWRG